MQNWKRVISGDKKKEYFDILFYRSYGCVYKAKYRETGHLLAIKQGEICFDFYLFY